MPSLYCDTPYSHAVVRLPLRLLCVPYACGPERVLMRSAGCWPRMFTLPAPKATHSTQTHRQTHKPTRDIHTHMTAPYPSAMWPQLSAQWNVLVYSAFAYGNETALIK